MGLFALTPEQGADNSIDLASFPDVQGIAGRYFVNRDPVDSAPVAYDQEMARKLWQVSEDLTAIRSEQTAL
jgi:hypothetical protein